MKYFKYVFSLFVLLLLSCNDQKIIDESADAISEGDICSVISVPLSVDADSRMGYSYQSKSKKGLKAVWKIGDIISVNPNPCVLGEDKEYALRSDCDDKETGVFCNADGFKSSVKSNLWCVYYPGKTIKNDIDFHNFSYEGQTQDGDNSLAHLAKYHSMRIYNYYGQSTTVSMPETMNFKGDNVYQSSCIKFELSGFNLGANYKPIEISISNYNENGFVESPFFLRNGWYSYADNSSVTLEDNPAQSSLSLQLKNCKKNPESITAYMMISNMPITLKKGKLRITIKAEKNGTVKYVYADKTLSANKALYDATDSESPYYGGRLNTIKVTSGWETDTRSRSTDYSDDGVVTTHHAHTKGNGKLNVIIMGDGFRDSEMTSYATQMERAYDNFFAVEPYKSLKDYFNVYSVNVVSEMSSDVTASSNGAVGKNAITKLGTQMTNGSTRVTGNQDMVMYYAKMCLTSSTGGNMSVAAAKTALEDAVLIVMINANCYAGTCHYAYSSGQDYGKGYGIGYQPLGKAISTFTAEEICKYTMIHETGGHGFGKLGDEYGATGSAIPAYYDEKKESLATMHSYGVATNVSVYSSQKSNMYWSDLFGLGTGKNYYENKEGLGAYSGAWTYAAGYFSRPTDNSLMNVQWNPDGQQFNAPSRRAIYHHIMRAAGVYADKATAFANFFEWDSAHPVQFLEQSNQLESKHEIKSRGVEQILPLEPPVLMKGKWIRGHYVE